MANIIYINTENTAKIMLYGFPEHYDESVDAARRFIRAAAVMPDSAYIGLQIDMREKEGPECVAFSSPDLTVADSDYRWMFGNCGTVRESVHEPLQNIISEGRKVYILAVADEDLEFDEKNLFRYFRELYTLLKDEGALVRITAQGGNRNGNGMVLFSMPREMSVSMKAMIAILFPNLKAVEFQTAIREKLDILLPASCLTYTVAHFLNFMSSELVDKRIEREDELFADLYDDDDELFETTIEDLEFSVRTYNCLKRAGINTLGKLKSMSDDEIRSIRNLGQKQFDEIKRVIRENEEKSISEEKPERKASSMEELDELIGLDKVKDQVRRIAAFAKMQKDLEEKGKPGIPISMNMEFMGNPGTAKTTVARIMAGIFNEVGLLPSPNIVEVGRADLVAKYEGQTADKVKQVFRNAKGKVLFIDEAYSLLESYEGEFGDEAISTIVQEMENNRENTFVIFAGYPGKMEEFFGRNQGLRSRVPFKILFEDYTEAQMVQIVGLEAKKKGFTVSADALAKVEKICREAKKNPDSGNGRFCRNLVEDAILEYAQRVYGSGADEEADCVLKESDFTLRVLTELGEKKCTMGFVRER